jgi:hypothetical protein
MNIGQALNLITKVDAIRVWVSIHEGSAQADTTFEISKKQVRQKLKIMAALDPHREIKASVITDRTQNILLIG